ncbi:MAG TPA: sulfurtransferase-like selenium metabolism protein YedF, partial [Anaerolineae bacterium]|nr:sulfurtransferase-like selenium metabolism protein YedF [Anaerolineae bacterium]
RGRPHRGAQPPQRGRQLRADELARIESELKLVSEMRLLYKAEGFPAFSGVEDLQGLVERGVEILACGTCLGYYELKEKIAVGGVSNMYTIAEALLRAGRVVNL